VSFVERGGLVNPKLRLMGAVCVAVLLAALATLGSAALAKGKPPGAGNPSAAQYQYGGKVAICHHTHSKKHPHHTITISRNALPAHLRHGDTIGPCP